MPDDGQRVNLSSRRHGRGFDLGKARAQAWVICQQRNSIMAWSRTVAMLIAGAVAAPVWAEPVKITFLGVGDIYDFDGDGSRGGFARLNAVARAERAANPNTLYLFDGDMLSPSLLSGFDQGQNTIDLTGLVPFDLAVPGNHEFDFGPANFFEKMKASNYPWAAINITNADGWPSTVWAG
jgi:2',3'-cyclic-nucleotide 2'-phosphodiesterase (5'-nucleotidase family)